MPPPPTAPSLEQFLARPAYGATQLHMTDAVWRDPITAGKVVGGLLDEIGEHLIGGDGNTPTAPTPRHVRFDWVGPTGVVVASFATNRGERGAPITRAAIESARRLRVGLWCFREDPGGVGTTRRQTDQLFTPRVLPEPGKLAPHARVIDTAERFEMAIVRTDRPGMVGRKVLRRDPVEQYLQIVMDAHWLQVNEQDRAGLRTTNIPLGDLLGIVGFGNTPTAYLCEPNALSADHLQTNPNPTADPIATVALPHAKDWGSIDGPKLMQWVYARILQRIGL